MEVTAKALAEMLGGVVDGNPDTIINKFAKIEEATPGSLTFLANEKYTHYIYDTQASAVLVREDFKPEKEIEAALIRVKDPYSALARLMTMVQSQKRLPQGIEDPVHIGKNVGLPEEIYIGAFAYIGDNVRLGKGVRIYPQAYIGDNVSIGDNTIIRSGVKIYEDCVVGKRCIVHSGAVIGADGFGFAPAENGYEKIPQIGNVVIDDDVEIGANTTIDRATFGSTRVGRGTKLDNLIQIAHNVEVGENNVFAAQSGVAGSTKIGKYNMIGGQVGIAGHITVGDFNEVGAQSGIPNNVGSRKRIIGYPAVDARTFAKNIVYISKLGELFNKK